MEEEGTRRSARKRTHESSDVPMSASRRRVPYEESESFLESATPIRANKAVSRRKASEVDVCESNSQILMIIYSNLTKTPHAGQKGRKLFVEVEMPMKKKIKQSKLRLD